MCLVYDVCVQMDMRVVQVQDTVMQLRKSANLPAEVEKSLEKAEALVKDSESSRRVNISRYSPVVCSCY